MRVRLQQVGISDSFAGQDREGKAPAEPLSLAGALDHSGLAGASPFRKYELESGTYAGLQAQDRLCVSNNCCITREVCRETVLQPREGFIGQDFIGFNVFVSRF